MKASKFSDAQKAFILKQGNDGVPVAEICRKAGISQATYFNWKKKYDGMRSQSQEAVSFTGHALSAAGGGPPHKQRGQRARDDNVCGTRSRPAFA